MRAELGAALDDQIRRLDALLARVWQVTAALGIAGGLALTTSIQGPLGLIVAATSGVFFAWFTLEAALIKRGLARGPLIFLSYAVEGVIPWLFLLILLDTQGPTYALGSWVPPLLVGVLVITAAARLRPVPVLLLGISSGAAFYAMYLIAIRPRLSVDERALTLYGNAMQTSRAISLAFGGGLGALITYALRGAIGRAERSVRAMDLFGKYRLEGKIAAGGMGVVHRATYCPEGGFERVVAVKLLHPHLADQPTFLDAFRAEAELSARLVHPNIVQVLDFGRTGESYFLAMEFVEGMTLGVLLRRARAARRLPTPSVAGFVVREILAGLVHSHGGARDADGTLLRVVHRDLCPANVLLSKSGDVKIADFGIARALRDRDTSETHTIAGHSAYMAPEQLRAGSIDERWDLFACGVIAFELLTVKPLFQRGSESETLLAIMAGEVPDVALLHPGVDPRWDAFVRRAVALDPADRFQNAREMLDAVDVLLESANRVDAANDLAALVAWALDRPDEVLVPATGSIARATGEAPSEGSTDVTRVDAFREEATRADRTPSTPT